MKLFMIFMIACIYVLDVYVHRIQRKRDVTTKSFMTFVKNIFSRTKTPLIPGSFKKVRNKNGKLR